MPVRRNPWGGHLWPHARRRLDCTLTTASSIW